MSNKLLATLSLVAAIGLTLPFVARTENVSRSAPPDGAPVESTRVIKARAVASEGEPQILSLEATPAGFQPKETFARRGKFLILLQNRTGQRNLSFYLLRENQERLAESEPKKRDWKAQVQLGPGTYIIGETSHPEWQSIIRVTP